MNLIIYKNGQRTWRFNTLRTRLFLSCMLVSFIPLILFSYTSIREIENFYENKSKSSLMSSANVVAGYITSPTNFTITSEKARLNSDIRNKAKEGQFRVLVFNNNGIVVADSNNGRAVDRIYIIPEVVKALEGKDNVTIHKNEQAVYAAVNVVDEYNNIIGAVLIVSNIDDVYELLNEMQSTVFFYMVIVAIFAIIIVSFMAKLFLSPFTKIMKILEKMADGHLDQRINFKRKDEFSDIANAFNNMAAKLEMVEVTRDEFVSNVSHELKTPLSSIKVLGESILIEDNVPQEMYVEFLQDINSEVDRMTNIVNDLLTLVKLDQREIALNKELIKVEKLVQDIVKRLSALASNKNIALDLVIEKETEMMADEMKLTLAISNIIENAIKYTEEGKVIVTVGGDHQNVYITVEDTGIGISEDEVDKIFGRFYRVDKTRDRETGGTGLGLAITHSTVLLHNGSIRVNSKLEEGTTFILRLPIVNQTSS